MKNYKKNLKISEIVSKHFGWQAFYESVGDNPYLDDFYKSMKNWSFHLQIFFLNSRFKQIQNISKTNNTTIQDRSIYEDYEVFTKNLFEKFCAEIKQKKLIGVYF